jgi:hypothetical protein
VAALVEALVGRITVIAALTTSAVNATSSRSYLNSRAIASGVARSKKGHLNDTCFKKYPDKKSK